MDEFDCLVTWTEQVAGRTTTHSCTRPATHVQHFDPMVNRTEPHRCHCGSWLPARDTETGK